MPAVEFYSRKMVPSKIAPIVLGPVALQPGLDQDPGYNLIAQENLDAMLANPYLKKNWEQLQDSGVVKVLDTDKADPSASEPDLTELNLTQAVDRVKATTSLELLESWASVDPRKGVQKAIDEQINKISPPDTKK